MSSSEIAKLETRWRENPQGLTFAPLAEAYRKLREPARALEVLAEGLSRHPDYIPASIVLGRCHLDLGQAGPAEAAFRRVLELDDENAIALRALADLAEQGGRLAEAAGRLQELLSVDRSNDEARAQLARIEEAIAAGPVVTGEPADYDWTPEVPEGADLRAETDDLMLEDNLQPSGTVEPLPDLVIDEVPPISSESASAAPLGDLVGKDFSRLGAEVPPLSDLATGGSLLPPSGDDEAELAGELEVTEPVELEPELERASEIELRAAERSEFQVESVTDDWMAGRAGEEADATEEMVGRGWTDDGVEIDAGAGLVGESDSAGDEAEPVGEEFVLEASAFAPAEEPASFAEADSTTESESIAEPEFISESESIAELEPITATEPVAEFEPAAALEPETDLEPVAEAEPFATADRFADPDRPDADLVVTETMAELYLRQGHRSEALRVYRELWLRSGDDLRLRERVDSLETELAAEESGAEATPATYAAPAPTRSVAAFLGSILSARPAGTPAAWTGEAGTRAQPLSEQRHSDSPDAAPTRPAADHLSLSSVFGESGSPVPPAVAAAAPADEDGISFDAFFGGDASAAPARARAASRDDDDLDQFHAWLQNLKR